MPSRRQFLEYGVMASAWAACPAVARLSLADSGREPYHFFRVIVDHTFADGAAFAAEASSWRAPVRAVGSDLGSVWMNDIGPCWRRTSAAIAGLTSGAALFCLEFLANDYGMSVVYRAEHSQNANGRVLHDITGSEDIRAWGPRLTAAGKRWSSVAAAMAMSCPAALKPDPRMALLNPAPQSWKALFSWVIAPGGRALVLNGRSQELQMHNKQGRG